MVEIDAAGQERAQAHVGDHPLAGSIGQQPAQRVGCVFQAARERLAGAVLGRLPCRPVGDGLCLAAAHAGVQDDEARRRQLADARENAPGRRQVDEAQIGRQRVPIDLGTEGGMRHQRLQLRAEEPRAGETAVVNRLLAEAVACQRQGAAFRVPQREGQHAVAAPKGGLDAPLADTGEQDLRVRVAAEVVAHRLQLTAQLLEIIDLAVERQHEAAVIAEHRLMTRRRQVQDRQSPVAKHDSGAGVAPDAGIVRPAMGDRIGHRGRSGAQRVYRRCRLGK